MFSEREKEVIKIIGRKKMTLGSIATELFKGERMPFDSSISVANSVRRIIGKCYYNELHWTLKKTRVDKKLIIERDNDV